MYTDEDWEAYKDIGLLIRTNAMFQRNDPKTRRPKASQGDLVEKYDKKIWKEYNRIQEEKEPSDSDLVVYNGKEIEYNDVNNFNELINRLTWQ